VPPDRLVTVDTRQPLEREASAVLRALRRLSPLSLPPR